MLSWGKVGAKYEVQGGSCEYSVRSGDFLSRRFMLYIASVGNAGDDDLVWHDML
jgi:hypothetical protein